MNTMDDQALADWEADMAQRYPLMYAPAATRMTHNGVEYIRMADDDFLSIHHCCLNTSTGTIIHAAKIT